MRALRRLIELRPEERILLAWSVGWLLAARCALLFLALAAARRILEKGSRKTRLVACTPDQIRWAVPAAARRLPGTRCLARALALETVLRQAGISSELRIGVAKASGSTLAAHAWVECEGRPFLPDEDLGNYVTLSPLPG